MFSRRKFVLIIVLLFLVLPLAAHGEKMEVGTVIGKVMSTDIKTYINGYQIPSMNIDGSTVIVAEDLRGYGFDVIWDPAKRDLRITENLSKEFKPITIENSDATKTGKILGDVLYTDIKTYIHGREIQSYNIGGYTTLLLRDLEEWGKIIWDEDKREARFLSDRLDSRIEDGNGDNFSFKINKLSETRVILENKGNRFYLNGIEAGFYDGPAMLSLKAISEQLGYFCLFKDGHYTVKKGGYGFTIQKDDKIVKRSFDGRSFGEGESELWHKPVIKSNDLFVSDIDLTRLFGLDKTWDPETKNIGLSYPEFEVKDYGNHEILGEKFILRSAGDSGPEIGISNRTLNEGYRYSSGFYNSERSQFERETYLFLRNGNNEIDGAVVYKDRILLLKTFENIKPDIKTHRLENEKFFGPFTNVRIDNPSKGYVETEASQFKIKGSIVSVNDDSLTVEIEKLNEDTNEYVKLSPQKLEIKDNEFCGNIILESGYGIYKIKASANIPAGFHGVSSSYTTVLEFFINYSLPQF